MCIYIYIYITIRVCVYIYIYVLYTYITHCIVLSCAALCRRDGARQHVSHSKREQIATCAAELSLISVLVLKRRLLIC